MDLTLRSCHSAKWADLSFQETSGDEPLVIYIQMMRSKLIFETALERALISRSSTGDTTLGLPPAMTDQGHSEACFS